jgi:hypothetical protein
MGNAPPHEGRSLLTCTGMLGTATGKTAIGGTAIGRGAPARPGRGADPARRAGSHAGSRTALLGCPLARYDRGHQAVRPGAAAATDAPDRTAARHRPAVRAGSAGIRPR